jgi:HD superfamily phosphohydrolase
MNDNTDFPKLNTFSALEKFLFSNPEGNLAEFGKGLNDAFDRLGFTCIFVDEKEKQFNARNLACEEIEKQGSNVSKVVKDVVWGMIELDSTTVEILDLPILQRLRYIRQNGFTYLVFPSASHVRLEHSLGVLAVVSKYISSINASAAQPQRYAEGLTPKTINSALALDLKHAAILHDIGHFPLSHVLETIFESDPKGFKIGGVLVQDFETCMMRTLPDIKSRLSEKLSLAILLSPRFKKFYTALRNDPWAYLRVACLVSGSSLEENSPGYSQLISGAVDCDKVDYLLRDSTMCNVPVAIDQARLFLNSALIECQGKTAQKLYDRGVLSLEEANLDKSALILVLNSSGVDTIEEVAFARATLYERVYRHSVTRNAERILAVAIFNATSLKDENENWDEVLSSFTCTDDTFIQRLLGSKSSRTQFLTDRLRRRDLPKRAFAFSPDFYQPIVPYVSIFSGGVADASSTYYHEVISKDPFHEVVEGLKERSATFRSNQKHLAIEQLISDESSKIALALKKMGEAPPSGDPILFFVPLPDHSLTPMSCAIVTREGELESSGDYSRAPQLVSAKEIGRSVGFVTCDPEWAEIVFIASQIVLYDYYGNSIDETTLTLNFEGTADPANAETSNLNVRAMKRFYVAESLAVRRCRIDKKRLTSHRVRLSESGYFDSKPRLAETVSRTPEIVSMAEKYREFSGQHNWKVTVETIRQFLNQFPPKFRAEARALLTSLNFLNREVASRFLQEAIDQSLKKIKKEKGSSIYLVPLAGTSAHMMLELLKQEFRDKLKAAAVHDCKSVHEMLGVAQPGDTVIFVDDNISSGTQFSAQLLSWIGKQNDSTVLAVKNEVGIEKVALDLNSQQRFSQLNVRLATCVGKPSSELEVKKNLAFVGHAINFTGLCYSQDLANQSPAVAATPLSVPFQAFLQHVGEECIRESARLPSVDDDCRSKALGYGNSMGRTVTLWNVPTSTFSALWCPGIVDNEPWFPLFIRRGYADDLVIA